MVLDWHAAAPIGCVRGSFTPSCPVRPSTLFGRCCSAGKSVVNQRTSLFSDEAGQCPVYLSVRSLLPAGPRGSQLARSSAVSCCRRRKMTRKLCPRTKKRFCVKFVPQITIDESKRAGEKYAERLLPEAIVTLTYVFTKLCAVLGSHHLSLASPPCLTSRSTARFQSASPS